MKMQRIHSGLSATNRVVAVFEASTAFFELPKTATFEELADRLVSLSEWHSDALISVNVKLNNTEQKLTS
jgi:hypothetical protein